MKNKKIVLGVTGGIAAYKAVEIASRLTKLGATVRVVMTAEAKEFVTELTFREITHQPVTSDMWDKNISFDVAHISLAAWADLIIIAPATANIIAKADLGIADDFLTTMLLASKSPIVYAPAMNTNMYEHPATQSHLKNLREKGSVIIAPDEGNLACGTSGVGRLPEPAEIVDFLINHFAAEEAPKQDLKGKKILVTAGGTIEPIDPVRFITNRSSGRQGYAVAEAAAARGADVVLISGRADVVPPSNIAKFVKVETALQMREAVLAEFPDSDIVIKSAAVADYRPKAIAANKIKKSDGEFVIELTRNPDILQELGSLKKDGQILVGFAAETQNLVDYAQQKVKKKNLDFIVANDVSRPGAGFAGDTNIVKIIGKDGRIEEFAQMTKRAIANIILDRVKAKIEFNSYEI